MTDQTSKANKASLQVIANPWQTLRQFTSARIALGRAGNSIPTHEMLAFQLDHARARDAVHRVLNIDQIIEELCAQKQIIEHTPDLPIVVNSKASNRLMYLQRPDLGRQLDEISWQKINDYQANTVRSYDLSIVITDGLSSTAIQNHAVHIVNQLVALLSADNKHDWSLAPITIVKQGRVACGDDVGEGYKAKITLILIGERPGLISPDSMGLYITWNPIRGKQDSSRNCISNIRPEGLNYQEACQKAYYLLSESLQRQISGIDLKDRSDDTNSQELESKSSTNFLTPPITE
ncbi:ethanolamine ammonia-lyase subunit EutC [Vibrio pectenicida]|uniref:Ethanolamine ammonia-lyase small subunit n=1 Tax=Vibrio pectenicida TaxID=62763 RepID=A0A3R9FMU1_9VIBR|nr:ethanolamine ammonia-lyase subunit EutC [Vibrio pectenicida]RSD30127.1 ethanolamine ammonia-lyase subunit EutC [Vibrio pectenicida]